MKALAEQNEQEVFEALYDFGLRTKHNRPRVFYLSAVLSFDNRIAPSGMVLLCDPLQGF